MIELTDLQLANIKIYNLEVFVEELKAKLAHALEANERISQHAAEKLEGEE